MVVEDIYPIHLRLVTRENFHDSLNRLPDNKRCYISSYFEDHHYFYLAYDSLSVNKPVGGFCIEKQKNDVIYIKGVHSFVKGMGRRMLSNIFLLLPDYQFFRINCTGEKLRKYYEQLGFEVYLKQPAVDIVGETYYELKKVREEKFTNGF